MEKVQEESNVQHVFDISPQTVVAVQAHQRNDSKGKQLEIEQAKKVP